MAGDVLSCEAEGVLLYYAYRDLRQCQAEVRDWFEALCCSQGLVGRVRVALDGLNVTLGGSLAALRQHTEDVEQRFGGQAGAAIDFKLAESHGRKNAAAALQSVRRRSASCAGDAACLLAPTCDLVGRTGPLLWPQSQGAKPLTVIEIETADCCLAAPYGALCCCRALTACQCRPARRWCPWAGPYCPPRQRQPSLAAAPTAARVLTAAQAAWRCRCFQLALGMWSLKSSMPCWHRQRQLG